MHSFSLILSLILPALYANIVLAVPLDLDSRDEGNANAYTGSGGQSPGGSVTNGGGLINVFSNNAGDGGPASSGNARGGDNGKGGHGGNAYSGVGGNSPGGSVRGVNDLVNIISGNAGSGGDARSGSALGGGDHGHDCDCP